MTYNTATIQRVFENLYSTLRRRYAQYAANYAGKQYFLFANIMLLKPDRIPYYTTTVGARGKSNPAGYLPLDISQYYLKERPMYFYDLEAFMAFRVGKQNTWNSSSNPPYFILNLFLNGSYQDVYINFEPEKMDVNVAALDAGIFSTYEKQILDLQSKVAGLILNLIVAQNQLLLLEKAYKENRYTGEDFLYNERWGARPLVDYWITSLQKDNRFIVKVCLDCSNIQTPTLPQFLTIAGAVSLTWLIERFPDEYDAFDRFLEEQTIVVERMVVGIEKQWKTLNGYQLSAEDAKAFEQATEMKEVVITAAKKTGTTAKKAGLGGWIIPAIILTGLLLSGTQKRSNGSK